MKRLILIIFSVICALGILGISVIRVTAQTNPANRLTVTGPTPTSLLTPTPVPTKIGYYLPYPGMLPDHPLYPLKMARDRIWLFFTTDQTRKVELLLLFADKRLGAARALIEGGQVELGVSTLTKAEKYLGQSVDQANKTRQAGKETTELYKKLQLALLKHQEVLKDVQLRVPSQSQEVIQKAIEESQRGYEKVTGFGQ